MEVTRDQLPSVVVGAPQNNSETTEGQLLLVEINAVDDVGIDRVVLNIGGLKGGDRSLTDMVFPTNSSSKCPMARPAPTSASPPAPWSVAPTARAAASARPRPCACAY